MNFVVGFRNGEYDYRVCYGKGKALGFVIRIWLGKKYGLQSKEGAERKNVRLQEFAGNGFLKGFYNLQSDGLVGLSELVWTINGKSLDNFGAFRVSRL